MVNRFDIAGFMKYQRGRAWGGLMPGDVVECNLDSDDNWMYVGFSNNGPPGTCGQRTYAFFGVSDPKKELLVCPSPVFNGMTGKTSDGLVKCINATLDDFTIVGHLSPGEWNKINNVK